MPPRDWRLRLGDIIDASRRIIEYTDGLTEDVFLQHHMAIDAVLKNFIVIGEAARFIPADVRQRYPDVPWRVMAAMRNRVAHGYWETDLKVVWLTATEDVPRLEPALQQVLEREG